MANPKRTYLFRASALLLSMLMVLSLVAVGVLADTQGETGNSTPTETTTPSQETTGSAPDTTVSVTTPAVTTPAVTTPAVTEPPFLVSASLEYSSYKQDYFVGDTFDPSGITVVLSYIGSSKRIPLAEYGNYTPKKLKATDTEVVVTFENGSTQSIPVNVSAKQLTNLSASYGQGFKIHYYEGESLSLTGISVTARYNDGSSESLDLSKLTFSAKDALSRKDTTIVASYGGRSFSFNVTVTPVKSITADIVLRSDLVCGQYQIFDKSTIKVTATYEDNHTAVVANYDVLDDALKTPGKGKITVSYFGATAQVSVSVLELTGIRIATKPTKLDYNEFDLPDITGMVVHGIYANHPEAPITGYTVDTTTPLVPNDDGEASITVTFSAFTDTVSVKVSPITKLVIVTPPTKTKYYEGEAIDFTGIVVKAVFKNGKSIDNFTGYTIPEDALYADSAKKPYVAYGNVKAEITGLNIIAIQGIGVVKKPDRLVYSTGELFDPTGMEIVAFYPKENGQDVFKPIEIGACTFSITRPLVPTDFDIIVTYKTFSAQPINITVSDKIVPASMSAKSLPKTEYVSGQPLSLEGLVLVLGLSDGSVKVLGPDEYITEPAAGTPVFAGSDTQITITYTGEEFEGNITLDIPITVSSKGVVSLLITPPAKTVYQEGERFNANGMTVRAVYNDNSVEPITNYTIIGEGPFIINSESATTVPITISAYGVESVINITVTPASISYVAVSTPPSKVVYQAGETFDPTGMVVQVVFGNGKVLDVPAEMYTISPTTPFRGGETTVTVSFRGSAASLSITVEGGEPPVSGSETADVPSGPSSTETNAPVTNPLNPSQTTAGSEKEGLPTGLTVLFISLIVFIVALVVVLIIYYRRHFC